MSVATCSTTSGVIAQRPFFESTARYRKTRRFREIKGLAPEVLQLIESVSEPANGPSGPLKRLIFDPPYEHQFRAVQTALVGSDGAGGSLRRDIVVMTGTGSGKTEAFLLPILGKLVNEAANGSSAFGSQSTLYELSFCTR